MRYLIADDDPLVCETLESFLSRLEDTTYCLVAGHGLHPYLYHRRRCPALSERSLKNTKSQ